MALNDALDNGEADACALKVFSAVQSLEDLEEFMAVPWVEPDAIVRDEVNRLALIDATSNLKRSRTWNLTRKLQPVGNEVDQDLPQHGGVAHCGGKWSDADVDFSGWFERP